MNKISLGINAVLIAAVGVLYYFHFSGKKDEVEVDATLLADRDSLARNLTMVYVNTDSLWGNYKLVEETNDILEAKRTQMRNEIERESSTIENRLNRKAEELQKKAQDFEAKADQMSETIAQIKMQALQEEDQELRQEHAEAQQTVMALKESKEAQLMNETAELNQEVNESILDYLEKYNKEHNYTYILSRGTGGGVILAHDALDITSEILVGLNKEYEEAKKEEKKEK